MTNLISQNDRIEINFALWTNTPIPAKAWFELLLWPGGYDEFKMPTQTNEQFEIRHLGRDQMRRERIRVTCLIGTAPFSSFDTALGKGSAVCSPEIEPWAYPAPVFHMRSDGTIFSSSNFRFAPDQARIIPSGQPIARSSKYPALAVIYSVGVVE